VGGGEAARGGEAPARGDVADAEGGIGGELGVGALEPAPMTTTQQPGKQDLSWLDDVTTTELERNPYPTYELASLFTAADVRGAGT
jgi:hypothetical protein